MAWYVLRRLALVVPILFAVIVLSFWLMHAAPGGPFDSELIDVDPNVIASIRAAYNLDAPVWKQFLDYLAGLLRGDLGPSLIYSEVRVSQIVATGLPISATVGLSAITVGLILGIGCGIIAALRKNSFVDYIVMAVAMTGVAIPTFITAPLLILFFGLYLGWLPLSGWNGGDPRHLVLPIIALALPKIATLARITRGSMLEALNTDYVRTARAKGLRERKVIFRHVLRPMLIPIVSYLGPSIATVMTGSVVIETIFGLPGIGRAFVEGATNRDYPVVMGIVIVYAVFIQVLNLLVDVIYAYLDPRIRQRYERPGLATAGAGVER
ncbi:MAG: ABC transporter permease subunit [Gammaproteobacteria bacterium]